MLLLYGLLCILLIIALVILAIPFIKNKTSFQLYLIFALLITLPSFVIYQFTGNKVDLSQWVTQGEYHYQLQKTFDQLGGVNGAINKIEEKLKLNPFDARGWFILGKLYLSKHNFKDARNAFLKAHQLSPRNKEITQFYEKYKQ